jgi:hypothetical protein
MYKLCMSQFTMKQQIPFFPLDIDLQHRSTKQQTKFTVTINGTRIQKLRSTFQICLQLESN